MTSRPPLLDPATAYALWASSYPARAHNPVMQAEERAMLDLMPTDLRGQSVLDAGCGSGRYLLHVLRRGAARIYGVDLAPQMLQRAELEINPYRGRADLNLVQGDLRAIPAADGWADVTVCALAVGHLEKLQPVLRELQRVTRPGGTVLCSDVHPIGHALGWLRDFKSGDRHFAVRHTQHLYSHWHTACTVLGLQIDQVLEPMLDPQQIPTGAHFDPQALQVPVALVFRLRRRPT